MQCPTCKLVSQTPDVCSWCKHPLPAPNQPAPPVHSQQPGYGLASARPAAPVVPGLDGAPAALPGQYTPQTGQFATNAPNLAPGQHAVYGQTANVSPRPQVPGYGAPGQAPYPAPPGQPMPTQQMPVPPMPTQQMPPYAYAQGQQNLYGQTMAMPAPGTMPTQQMPAQNAVPGMQPQMTQRVSLTGEVLDAVPRPVAPISMPGQFAAAGGGALPVAAFNPALMKDHYAPEESIGLRVERFLAMSLPVLALSVLLIHFVPTLILYVVMGDLFLISLLLGASRAVPSYDDAVADCTGVLLVAFLFGPVVALVLYAVACVARQEGNAALLVILALSLVIPNVLGLAFASSADTTALLFRLGLFQLTSFFGVCLGFFGWLVSSFFRPVNE